MAQKRWDIQVLFFSPPLMMHGPLWFKGPVIRIGRNPGPGEMQLSSYQGVAELHATIEAYEGNTIMLSAIEPHEVRVAPHENVEWRHVYPITKAVKLSPGDVIHLGSLERGCRLKLLQCRSFDWRQEQLGAVVNQENDEFVQNQFAAPKRIESSVPKWFIPTMLGASVIFVAALIPLMLPDPEEKPIGIEFEDEDPEQFFLAEKMPDLDASVLDGFQSPFEDFVMKYNANISGYEDIKNDPSMWDEKYYERTVSAAHHYSKYKTTWKTFERAHNEYKSVVRTLKDSKMPSVFAGIPITETRYQKNLVSPVCAGGIWQFMPEVGHRVGLEIKNCRFRGDSNVLWSPQKKAVPKSYVYVNKITTSEGYDYKCKIKSCEVDERIDIERSTEGAVELLGGAWEDDLLRESGSIVQMTIIGHNVGHNDAAHGTKRSTNVLPAYKKYMKKSKKDNGISFYGDNILCGSDKDPHKAMHYGDRCGGVIPNQGQHYGYNVTAQHFLAVCYYAENYGNDSVFKAWKPYLKGYCSNIKIPSPEELN